MKAFLTADINNCDDSYVDHVGFLFNAEDLSKWEQAIAPCKALNATYISFPDYRCVFFEETGVPTDFRADGCEVRVFGNQKGMEFIRFSGFQKHVGAEGREWFTDRIYFTELSSAISEPISVTHKDNGQ